MTVVAIRLLYGSKKTSTVFQLNYLLKISVFALLAILWFHSSCYLFSSITVAV